jgi:hypothetical protein
MSDRVRLDIKQTTIQRKPLILDKRGTTRRPSVDQIILSNDFLQGEESTTKKSKWS